jgi:beta-xylosidase
MKPDGTELLDEGVYIFDGRQNHPTIEGPKMYKRNGYYYIFAPAGGVAEGWQTVLRSKYIYGPYEDKIVLHQGNTTTNGPHQGAWVELESGESWFLHFQDKDAYGRITHLQPMEWVNDWPVMGKNINSQGLGEPVDRWKKPRTSNDQTEIKVPQTSDDFKGETLGPQWQWQANFIKDWFALTENGLTLFAVNQPEQVNTLYETPNILTQKFPAPKFTATTKLHFYPERDGDYSGLIVLGYEYSGIMLKTQGERVCIAHIYGKQNNNQVTEEETVVDFLSNNSIFLRVIVEDGARCQLSYSGDGNAYSPVGKPFLASKGKWVGAQLGIFCLNQGIRKSSGYSQFEWFTIH